MRTGTLRPDAPIRIRQGARFAFINGVIGQFCDAAVERAVASERECLDFDDDRLSDRHKTNIEVGNLRLDRRLNARRHNREQRLSGPRAFLIYRDRQIVR